jgi:hypothetical protein
MCWHTPRGNLKHDVVKSGIARATDFIIEEGSSLQKKSIAPTIHGPSSIYGLLNI